MISQTHFISIGEGDDTEKVIILSKEPISITQEVMNFRRTQGRKIKFAEFIESLEQDDGYVVIRNEDIVAIKVIEHDSVDGQDNFDFITTINPKRMGDSNKSKAYTPEMYNLITQTARDILREHRIGIEPGDNPISIVKRHNLQSELVQRVGGRTE